MKIKCGAAVIYKGMAYISDSNGNALWRLDMASGKVSFVTCICSEENVEGLYTEAYLYKNIAWFIPKRAKHIARINLDTLNIRYYDLPCISSKIRNDVLGCKFEYFKFMDTVCYENTKLILVSTGFGESIIIDLEKESVELLNLHNIVRSAVSGCCYNSRIWLNDFENCELVSIDMSGGDDQKYKTYALNGHYLGIGEYKGKLYCAPHDVEYIAVYDNDKDKIEYISLEGKIEQGEKYHSVWFSGGKIWLLPWRGTNHMIEVDVNERKVKKHQTVDLCKYNATYVKDIECDSEDNYFIFTSLLENDESVSCIGKYMPEKKRFELIEVEADSYEEEKKFIMQYGGNFLDGFAKIGRVLKEDEIELSRYLSNILKL